MTERTVWGQVFSLLFLIRPPRWSQKGREKERPDPTPSRIDASAEFSTSQLESIKRDLRQALEDIGIAASVEIE